MSKPVPPPVVLVTDPAPSTNRWLQFSQPHRLLVATSPDAVLPCLQEADAALAEGYYLAGYLSYEAALGLDSVLAASPEYTMPLFWLGVFSAPACIVMSGSSTCTGRLDWEAELSSEEYRAALGSIRSEIAAGSTYQANFTYRLRSSYAEDPWELFSFLYHNQPSSCCMYVDTGRWAVCSVSPELFFALEGSTLTVRPMKGTLRRGRWSEEDDSLAKELHLSEKDRAENLMIVDMMRNDLGRICQAGSIKVPRLFDIERHPTVLQMTSTVTGTTNATFSQIIRALFPPASVTGAPKVETMRILARTERSPREVYTGSVGYMTPGRKARFNVAIRTVIVDQQTGVAQCGIGSGITWDSTPEQEYQECLLKIRFTDPAERFFQLLETLRWEPPAGFVLLATHLARLEQSAQFFNFRFDRHKTLSALEAALLNVDRVPTKVRLLLSRSGKLAVNVVPLKSDPLPPQALVKFAKLPVNSAETMLFHKTTHRQFYRDLLELAPECYDLLLWNEQAFVTELTRFNLLSFADGQWTTPPLEHGLLAGSLRQELLQTGVIRERPLTKYDLGTATALAAINSVRGMLILSRSSEDYWILEPTVKPSDRDIVFAPLFHCIERLMHPREG